MGETLTVKFISTVSTIGSQESTVSRLTKLSAAAGKFNVTIGTSIKNALKKSKTDSEDQTPIKRETKPNTRVVTKTIENCSPEDASRIATFLFNLMDNQDNSDSYTDAKSRFDTCKRQVLAGFSTDDYDKLSAEERKQYATRMIALNAPFKYTTQSIHIKYGQNQTVYSSTRRVFGTSHWAEDFYDKHVDIKKLKERFDVTFRQPQQVDQQSRNNSSPASGSGASNI